jgi:imidazolonepropionase
MRTDLLIKNIKRLVQVEENPELKICGAAMSDIQTITDAYLYIKDGIIDNFGRMDQLTGSKIPFTDPGLRTIDALNKFVFPSFCDSHTHLVYAGSRELEYIDKIRGLSYEGEEGFSIRQKNSMKLQKMTFLTSL